MLKQLFLKMVYGSFRKKFRKNSIIFQMFLLTLIAGMTAACSNVSSVESTPNAHSQSNQNVEKIQFICASDDVPFSIIVTYPFRGAPEIQLNGLEHVATLDAEHNQDNEEGTKGLRFNFQNNEKENRTLIIYTADRTEKQIAKRTYWANYYNFSGAPTENGLWTGDAFACFANQQSLYN